MLATLCFSHLTLRDALFGAVLGNIFGEYREHISYIVSYNPKQKVAFVLISTPKFFFTLGLLIAEGDFEMISSGLYSQNGILAYMAMNLYLVSDAWSQVAAIIAVAFTSFILSIILPNSKNAFMDNNLMSEQNDIQEAAKLKVNMLCQINLLPDRIVA